MYKKPAEMKWMYVLGAGSMLLAACFQGASPASTVSNDASAAPPTVGDVQADAAAAEPDASARTLPPPKGNTWSYLYGTYIAAADSPGHCGKAGCHQKVFHGFKCGNDKDTCYAGLVAVGIVNPGSPARSLLIDPIASPLYWVNPDTGIMPLDNAHPNDQAAADFTAWVVAGATNDATDAGAADADRARDAAED
jgi:hypothetical protein